LSTTDFSALSNAVAAAANMSSNYTSAVPPPRTTWSARQPSAV